MVKADFLVKFDKVLTIGTIVKRDHDFLPKNKLLTLSAFGTVA